MGRPKKIGSESQRAENKQDKQKRVLAEEKIRAEITREQLKKPPFWLDSKGKTEFLRIIKALPDSSILSDQDYSNLGVLCDTYSRYRDLQKQIKTVSAENYRNIFMMLSKASQDMAALYKLLNLHPAGRIKSAEDNINKNNENLTDTFGDI